MSTDLDPEGGLRSEDEPTWWKMEAPGLGRLRRVLRELCEDNEQDFGRLLLPGAARLSFRTFGGGVSPVASCQVRLDTGADITLIGSNVFRALTRRIGGGASAIESVQLYPRGDKTRKPQRTLRRGQRTGHEAGARAYLARIQHPFVADTTITIPIAHHDGASGCIMLGMREMLSGQSDLRVMFEKRTFSYNYQ